MLGLILKFHNYLLRGYIPGLPTELYCYRQQFEIHTAADLSLNDKSDFRSQFRKA